MIWGKSKTPISTWKSSRKGLRQFEDCSLQNERAILTIHKEILQELARRCEASKEGHFMYRPKARDIHEYMGDEL